MNKAATPRFPGMKGLFMQAGEVAPHFKVHHKLFEVICLFLFIFSVLTFNELEQPLGLPEDTSNKDNKPKESHVDNAGKLS